jgi:hypothetical protein
LGSGLASSTFGFSYPADSPALFVIVHYFGKGMIRESQKNLETSCAFSPFWVLTIKYKGKDAIIFAWRQPSFSLEAAGFQSSIDCNAEYLDNALY